MSNKDEFDLEIEDDAADDSFDEAELESAAAQDAPARKKSGGMLFVVVLLAVVGGGVFAAVKFLGVQLPFGGAPAPVTTAVDTAPGPAQGSMTVDANLPPDNIPPAPEPVAGLDSPGALPDLGFPPSGETNVPAIDAPWDMTAGAAEGSDNNAAPAETGNNNIVDPFASLGAQDVTSAVNGTDSTPPAMPSPAEQPGQIVDPFAISGGESEPAQPVQQEAPVSAEVAPLSTPPAADPAQAARIAALEQKVAGLERSLSDSEKALQKAKSDLTRAEQQLAEKTAALAQARTAPAATLDKEPVRAKTAAPRKAAVKKAPAAARPVVWVLRSAKPGQAMISEKGSNEMRTVSVGDTLPGIGRVTAITTNPQGRWVVNGTQGVINQ